MDEPQVQSDGREFVNSYDYYGENINVVQRSEYSSVPHQRQQQKYR